MWQIKEKSYDLNTAAKLQLMHKAETEVIIKKYWRIINVQRWLFWYVMGEAKSRRKRWN